jgi:FMN phosphatase YigB (HAD superfamily)
MDEVNYPDLAGYCLLVRDLTLDRNWRAAGERANLYLYLERIITEANEAEYRAYAALPEVKTSELGRWFYPESPAMKEIINLLSRHQKKRWVISNPLNPSTKRILSIKVKKVSQDEASVNTIESWYLRW